MHVCMYDENHKLIEPGSATMLRETEFQKLQRCTLELLENNQSILREMINRDKSKSSDLECFKCCRKFVHEAGLGRHYEKHIGEILEMSPPEEEEKLTMITLCVICGEVFAESSDAWNHLQVYHVQVSDEVCHWKISKDRLGMNVTQKDAKLSEEKTGSNDHQEVSSNIISPCIMIILIFLGIHR